MRPEARAHRGGDEPERATDHLSSEQQTRRAFLRTALAGGCVVAAARWLSREPLPRAFEPFPVASAGALAPGESLAFRVPGTSLDGLLVRLDRDSYLAVDRRCPHLGCPVLWSPDVRQFHCPCHRAAFDGQTGAVLAGPPPKGLRRFAIEQREGALWLGATASAAPATRTGGEAVQRPRGRREGGGDDEAA